MEIKPGTFYEFPGGVIARVVAIRPDFGYVAYCLDDGVDIRNASDEDVALWVARPDLEDFPNARDPILPLYFRKNFGLAKLSEIPTALESLKALIDPRGHEALLLALDQHGLGKRLRRMIMDAFVADPVNAITDTHLSAAAALVAEADAERDAIDPDTMLKVTTLQASGYAIDHLVAFPAGIPSGIEAFHIGGVTLLPQGIASGLDAEKTNVLVAFILAQASRSLADTRDAMVEGVVPFDITSFQEVQDHIDANELASGQMLIFEPHLFVGRGVNDLDEAWCGVLNCVMSATDAAIRRGEMSTPAASEIP